jgi:uncharacterized membrane protein YeiH
MEQDVARILLTTLDLGGTFVFAISGALAAVRNVSAVASTMVGGLACFALRYAAIRHGWHLPAARVALVSTRDLDGTAPKRDHRKP